MLLFRTYVFVGASVLAALSLTACAQGGGIVGGAPTVSAEATATADWRKQVQEFTGTSGPLMFPENLPAGLDNAVALTMEHQMALTFYTPGEPLVTICSGDLAKCRKVLGTSKEIRVGIAGDLRFVVVLGRSEDPELEPALSPAQSRFWSDVRMSSSKPGWLT